MGNLLLRGELAPQAAQTTQHESQPAPGIGVAQQPQQVFPAAGSRAAPPCPRVPRYRLTNRPLVTCSEELRQLVHHGRVQQIDDIRKPVTADPPGCPGGGPRSAAQLDGQGLRLAGLLGTGWYRPARVWLLMAIHVGSSPCGVKAFHGYGPVQAAIDPGATTRQLGQRGSVYVVPIVVPRAAFRRSGPSARQPGLVHRRSRRAYTISAAMLLATTGAWDCDTGPTVLAHPADRRYRPGYYTR